MKGIKWFFLLFLVLGIFHMNLFSLITSRVEGIVMDKDSAMPIEDAKIVLFKCGLVIKSVCLESKSIKTDSNGYFKFDDLKQGEFSLLVFKDGYATSTPIHILKEYISQELTPSFKSSEIRTFYLKEGQIKHFRIMLEKEAVLKVQVFKKTYSEYAPLNEDVTIFIVDKENNSEICEMFQGTFQSKYLREGYIKVTIYAPGYPEKIYDNIELKKGIPTNIEYVLDFTTGSVIHGYVINKNPLMRMPHTEIIVFKVGDNFSITSSTNEYGEFWIGGLEPGVYDLSIHRTIFKTVRYKTQFKIDENEKKEMNIEIEGGF
jgi:hypothetical protein